MRPPLTLAFLALCLASFAASARTIEASSGFSEGTSSLVAAVDSSGFYFGPVGDTIDDHTAALFPGPVPGQEQLGIAAFADASAGDDVARAVARLTDGQPGEGMFETTESAHLADSIALDSLGSSGNGNGDGVWADIRAMGAFVFEGGSVRDVGVAALLALVVLGLGLRLTSALA